MLFPVSIPLLRLSALWAAEGIKHKQEMMFTQPKLGLTSLTVIIKPHRKEWEIYLWPLWTRLPLPRYTGIPRFVPPAIFFSARNSSTKSGRAARM